MVFKAHVAQAVTIHLKLLPFVHLRKRPRLIVWLLSSFDSGEELLYFYSLNSIYQTLTQLLLWIVPRSVFAKHQKTSFSLAVLDKVPLRLV